jgi:hypothetical protein
MKKDDPFETFNNFISLVLIAIIVTMFLGIIFSCRSNDNMYHIYLEHDPREPLYSTSSLQDAQEYYEYYKPFHSDMYIQTTEKENNLVILK